ncbi:hypothetical protein TGRH88_032750 [Toxoplasma gondii]|uniref:Sugar transport protein n=1 Tax=Toxoplasma gondii TaxID=5811 RepID=A0A7J6K6S3_TOXGO|nr:hypothetical protein TGRH88_032750 [Toxoplasma gondii]
MPDGNSIVGGIAVLAAILATGSVAVPRKLERIRKLEPPLEDAVYVLYLCCGYAGSAFLACGLLPLNQVIMDDYSMRISCAFTWWGALSGALVVAAINAGFAAISRVGMAVHAAISMGTAVVTSFLWGVLVNNDRLALLWVDIFAVVCLIAGSSISAFPKEIARSCESCCLKGPMSFVPPEDKGIAFLPSFATGIIMAAVLALSIRLFVGKQKPAWHFRRAFPFGLLSGFLYMMAILAVIIAIPRISFAVAYPSKQTAIVVSGCWGILFFRELRGGAVAVFSLGSSLVLTGVVLLSNFTYPERVGIPSSIQPSVT